MLIEIDMEDDQLRRLLLGVSFFNEVRVVGIFLIEGSDELLVKEFRVACH